MKFLAGAAVNLQGMKISFLARARRSLRYRVPPIDQEAPTVPYVPPA